MSTSYPELGAFVRQLVNPTSMLQSQIGDDIWIYVVSFILLSSSAVVILQPYVQSEVKVPIPLATRVSNKKKRKLAYSFEPRETLKQGYENFKEKPFGVDSVEGVKLIVPIKFLDKLKSHPALSFEKSIDSDLVRPFTRLGGLGTMGVNTIHSKLNPSLSSFVPHLHRIVREHLPVALGSPNDWTETMLHESLTKIICRLSSFVMHDKEASENPEWLRIIESYVICGTNYAQALKMWPPFLRPFVSGFYPQRKELATLWNTAREIVKATLDAKKSGAKPISDPPTILDHLTSGPNEKGIDDVEDQVQQQLLLAVASIHTTSSSVLHCIYDLAARPEYVDELRQEAKEVLEACDGVFTKQGLAKLEKLDSFMKESQRVASPDLTTFQRIATQSLTLPDGTFVPAKTKMELPTSAVNVDEKYFDNPNTFDGLRFYHRRQNGESNMTYTSVGKTNLGWGVGRHACPGRFFADIEIKIMLSELLIHYDIKNPDGEGRSKNLEFETIVFPNPEARIMVKEI